MEHPLNKKTLISKIEQNVNLVSKRFVIIFDKPKNFIDNYIKYSYVCVLIKKAKENFSIK